MLFDDVDQVLGGTLAHIQLAFADHDVLLEVFGGGFAYTKELRVGRHFHLQVLEDPEKVVNGVFACENNGGVIQRIHALLTEFICGDPLNRDQFAELQCEVPFVPEFVIGRILIHRLGLRNEDRFYLLLSHGEFYDLPS